MNPVGIVTDSHAGISVAEAEKLGIRVLPMPFYIDGECYYEGVDLTKELLFQKMQEGAEVSTSQPAPADLMKMWDEALEEYEQILHIPLSSGLSGSCMTAAALSREDKYQGRVLVVDNGRIATPLHRSLLDAAEMIREGCSAPQIRKILERGREELSIYLAVDTLEYLKKGGRITPAAAAVGTVLHIKPVLKLDVGKLDSFKKCRGLHKAKKIMIDALKEDMETKYKDWYDRGEIYLMAAGSASQGETEKWLSEIRDAFPGMEVMYDELTLGICCHTGPGALGIGCSLRPRRPE